MPAQASNVAHNRNQHARKDNAFPSLLNGIARTHAREAQGGRLDTLTHANGQNAFISGPLWQQGIEIRSASRHRQPKGIDMAWPVNERTLPGSEQYGDDPQISSLLEQAGQLPRAECAKADRDETHRRMLCNIANCRYGVHQAAIDSPPGFLVPRVLSALDRPSSIR